MRTAAFSLFFALLVAFVLPASAELLTSEDSEEAVARQTPRLKQQLKKAGFEFGAPLFVRIFKQPNQLELWLKKGTRFELFRTYAICYRSGFLGPKLYQGDDQAPEGFYSVTADWMHPFSDYHLAFNIRYPNDLDSQLGRTGSAIMVHGGCSSSGCFAMTDEAIEEIYTLAEAALRNGQETFKVHVFPFHLTERNLARHRNSRWYDFWQNLKTGYDLFLTNGVPANEFVVEGHYEFEEITAHCALPECEGEACEQSLIVADEAIDSLWQEIIAEQEAALTAAMNDEAATAAANELANKYAKDYVIEKAPSGNPDEAFNQKLD